MKGLLGEVGMILTPMFRQSIVGIFASLSQAFQFFQRQRKVAPVRSSKLSPSIGEDADRVLVVCQQVVAPFAAQHGHKEVPFPTRPLLC